MKKSLQKIYRQFSLRILTGSLFLLFVLFHYLVLLKTTVWVTFITDNHPVFVLFSIGFTLLNSLLMAVSLTGIVYIIDRHKSINRSTTATTTTSLFLSFISTGCAVCGGFLLPLFGVAASLTAFPFLGLEMKALSTILLVLSLVDILQLIQGKLLIRRWIYVVVIAALLITYLIPRLPREWRQKVMVFGQRQNVVSVVKTSNQKEIDAIFNEINPEKGYTINARYGDIGVRMVQNGVIDLEKFKTIYEKLEHPLTSEQIAMLTKGSEERIIINRQNARFLLNFFWALGLLNKTRILTEGQIAQYGADQIGNFASTGGWTLGKTDAMNYFAAEDVLQLSSEEEAKVQKVAATIYRPCCNNSTAFPDCNHGMALLAVLELMSKSGATEADMYEAGKYFNAFWFPGNYYDLALYFKNKEDITFSKIPAQKLLGQTYSSASGWQAAKQWLSNKGIIPQPPSQGSGCGV